MAYRLRDKLEETLHSNIPDRATSIFLSKLVRDKLHTVTP